MAHLRDVGHAVGEYVGDGQGDGEVEVDMEVPPDRDGESDADDSLNDEAEDSTGNARPLLFFYDCEATGFSIYDDNITEIAAKVVGVPLSSVSKPSFSSFVHTPRSIPKRGIYHNYNADYQKMYNVQEYFFAVSDITGITAALLRHEQPLSLVLKEFWRWLSVTIRELAESLGVPHTPGTLTAYVSPFFTVSLYSPGSSQWLSLRLPHSSGGD